MTNSTLKAIRTDHALASFWMRVTATAEELHVPKAALPRCRKMPRRYVYCAQPDGLYGYNRSRAFLTTTQSLLSFGASH